MNPITRRRFLEGTLTTAALTALGQNETAHAERRVTGRRHSPNDRIQVACIGLRGRGRDHIGGYLNQKDVDLVALCDVDAKILGTAQESVTKTGKPQPKGYSDLRKLLEDPKIDAVSIATPNHWHSLAAIWAMQAGKDVYVEKPVSHNVSEGRRMVEAARKYGRICQAGTQIRSNSGSREAIKFIHEGGIGKVFLARGLCYKTRNSIGHKPDAPAPAGVDYDLWLGPAPTRAFSENRFHYNWHWHWDYGNGDLGNQGIHQMDVCRWALNKNMLPTSVMGLGGRFGYSDDGETPNTELTFFDYGDAKIIFEVRGLKTPPMRGAMVGNIIYGADGYVVFPNYDKATAFNYKDEVIKTFEGGGDHYANFLGAMRSRKVSDLHGDILEGHLSSALCHLGNISYRLGGLQPFNSQTKAFGEDRESYATFAEMEKHLTENGVKLEETSYHLGPRLAFDAKHERFSDSREANAMLSRAYRKPFVVPEHV